MMYYLGIIGRFYQSIIGISFLVSLQVSQRYCSSNDSVVSDVSGSVGGSVGGSVFAIVFAVVLEVVLEVALLYC